MKWRLTLLVFLLMSMVCRAEEAPHVRVELISEHASVAPGSSFSLLLRQTIDEGWHTYWRNPGDSGAAPTISWDERSGVSISPFDWPYPERIAYGPLMNFGYHNEVLLPFQVFIPADFTGTSLSVSGAGRVLVCADICIPQQVSVDLTLPVGLTELDSESKEVFSRARSLIPTEIDLAAKVDLISENIILNLPLPISSADRVKRIEYFPYTLGLIENSAEQSFGLSESGLSIVLKKGFAFDDSENLDLSGVVVIEESSGKELVLSSFTVQAGKESVSRSGITDVSTEKMSVLAAILFAFLGGLILNLMPCVFPVLSIKILSLVETVNDSNHSLRLHGWVYAAGVIASFITIAALLILLRLGGESIGWGFQLQSPFVVAFLAYLFFLIGLNFLGVFDIGGSVMTLGDRGPASGYLGSFATGVLATVVAAPCTAPFMGAAVGFALTQSVIVSLLIFGSLGFGMALPYLLLTYLPKLLEKLPAPGRWMETLKEIMAFPMFASAIWLLWVLDLQVGPTGTMQIMVGLLVLGFAVWLLKLGESLKVKIPALVSVLVATYLIVELESSIPSKLKGAEPITVEESQNYSREQNPKGYDRQAVFAAVQRGPVFVNFTAAWCITCKVNEVNALNTSAVQKAMSLKNVTYFKADWTTEDPAITAALAEYGRSGVPLYLLYKKGADHADVLPQLLTKGIVLDALGKL